MATLLKFRLGVADDPTALQPNLNDCLAAMLQHAEVLMADVLTGLAVATNPSSPKRVAAFQDKDIQHAVASLVTAAGAVSATYKRQLSQLVYEGGGKEQVHTELLRYEDLQLFADEDLDQSIEVARAQQEVSLSVDDVLPALDALISTLLGWRTIQSGLNPLRPDVFVRALQACLSEHVPDARIRASLITPSAGLLGVTLRKLYRELSDWLRSCGIEPAVPVGGKLYQGSGASGKATADSVANTLLTLDRLRHLLAGDYDVPKVNDHLYTVPASMAMLQEMKQVDNLVQRLEKKPRAEPPGSGAGRTRVTGDEFASPRLGHQLGQEVVRLMFDNLKQDRRLLPEFKRQFEAMEPAFFTLARHDSRFFSDRTHPARQFLERVTQRSLAYSSESDEGWRRFLLSVEDSVLWLDSKVVDAELFGELIDHLQDQWSGQDLVSRGRREGAARALLHAEQRNLLAQKIAAKFDQAMAGMELPAFVGDFLKGSWAQVVAEAQLSCVEGSDDPYGYHALVEELLWSVQPSAGGRGRSQRLAQMIPPLLARLRQGLDGVDYPPELTSRFFDHLITLHQAALEEGRDPGTRSGEAPEPPPGASAAPAMAAPAAAESGGPWLAEQEAEESGYQEEDSYLPEDVSGSETSPEPVGAAELRTGTWVELMTNGAWVRVQLTWASPHATLFMFTSQAGTAHSMSRRTLERLRGQGLVRVVADRNVLDDAFDQVAQAALKNSLDPQS